MASRLPLEALAVVLVSPELWNMANMLYLFCKNRRCVQHPLFDLIQTVACWRRSSCLKTKAAHLLFQELAGHVDIYQTLIGVFHKPEELLIK